MHISSHTQLSSVSSTPSAVIIVSEPNGIGIQSLSVFLAYFEITVRGIVLFVVEYH